MIIRFFIYLCLSCTLCCSISSAKMSSSLTPGSGANPAPINAGDISNPTISSNPISNWGGSIFPTKEQQIPETIYLRTNTYSHDQNNQFAGQKIVLTIRPATMHDPIKRNLLMTVLKTNPSIAYGSSTVIDVNQEQLVQIQRLLYPGTNNLSAQRLSSQPWIFSYLPIVRLFSHYAILLGVVFATVLMAFAAWSLTSGERGAAQRIASTCIGLIVLLCAFTIYKLLLINASSKGNISPNPSHEQNQTYRLLPLLILSFCFSLLLNFSGGQAYAQSPTQSHGLDFFSINTAAQKKSVNNKVTPSTQNNGNNNNSSIVTWFEKFDQLREQYRPTESDKVILTRPLMQEAERVQQWTNTAAKISKRYLLLAKSIRSLTVPTGLSDVKEYRDLTADWYQDAAGVYLELIRPRPAARTIEDLQEQLDAVKKRSESLAENINNLKSMDRSLRQQYNVHMAIQDDAIQQFVRSK